MRALAAIVLYGFCLKVSEIDLGRLVSGLPRLAGYLAKSWQPNFEDFDAVLRGAGETIAIATLGTTLGAVLAVPLCLLGARNITPALTLYVPARAILNVLRSIDTFVFALLFVAAVGLGPFSGILGVAFHVAGSIAKLSSEEIEAVDPRPIEALTATGPRVCSSGVTDCFPRSLQGSPRCCSTCGSSTSAHRLCSVSSVPAVSVNSSECRGSSISRVWRPSLASSC